MPFKTPSYVKPNGQYNLIEALGVENVEYLVSRNKLVRIKEKGEQYLVSRRTYTSSKKTLQRLRQADEIKKQLPNVFIRRKHKSNHARDTLKNDERKHGNPAAEQTSETKSNSDTGHNQRKRLKQSHTNSKKEDQERRLLPAKSSV
jgi:hypothetical protein